MPETAPRQIQGTRRKHERVHRGLYAGLRSGVLAILFALAPGCGRAPPPELPPQEIVSRAVGRMQSLKGFHFVIDRQGAPAFLDQEQTLSFRRAEGDFTPPDRAAAVIRIIGPGIVTEVKMISIGEMQWETHFLTREWVALPPNWGFNPALLFDPQVGIQPILEQNVSAVTLRGIEALQEAPGLPLYALQGWVEGEALHQLSYGMMGPERMEVELWIAPETFDLHRMRITHRRPNEPEPTLWQVDFWDFDAVVDIEPPQLEGGDT